MSKWQNVNSKSGPNANEEIFYSSALSKRLSAVSSESPELFSPDSPDTIYQTTSPLPSNEVVYYYHHDHLGNIRAITDQSGNVVERHDFYPFGEEITNQPQSKDQYLFTGKQRDSETGLDYFGARYYSSSLSRWMSADKVQEIKQRIKEPQEWDLYIYSANNPLKYKDPSGKFKVYAVGIDYNPITGRYNNYTFQFRFTSVTEPIKTMFSLGLNFVNIVGAIGTISTVVDIISWGSKLISTATNPEPPGWIKYEPNLKSFLSALWLEMKTDPKVEQKFNEMFKELYQGHPEVGISEVDAEKFLKEIQEKFPEIKDLYDWDKLLEQAIKHRESSLFEHFWDWLWGSSQKERSVYIY